MMFLRNCLVSCVHVLSSFARRCVRSLRGALGLGPSQSQGGDCTEVTEVMRALPPGSDEVVALAVTEELSTEVTPFASQDPVRPVDVAVIPEDTPAADVEGSKVRPSNFVDHIFSEAKKEQLSVIDWVVL
ncbi:uncharacterized protein LOC123538427 isoform X2 [Mercenaria mercenaria]|uniref:uncharacterized protein LOC123538427 isoform X2 n=1 Tax=Mercenaria mercenaria TaxID=6596 RepID=UPI00234E697F|nr:uncharacterized protein LOC123538427 isoform X2 [Mercenaria mercenaria]